ncbi:MAG: lysophospholipid acyltransferase family protein [Deltaproteobacteria bacterium]|nr:lysophospholipid acyltransferase family protein [Deltaproteobacteria bacterium]
MKTAFYRLLARAHRLFGPWAVAWPAWWIVSWYFVFAPRRRRASQELYRAVFPNRGWWFHLAAAWRQFQNFRWVFVDRLALEEGRLPPCQARGHEHLAALARRGEGAVLLMSHLGDWEALSVLLKHQGTPLMLYLGQQPGEELEARQKEHLGSRAVEVVRLAQGGGSALDALAAYSFLKRGGLVSLAGDRLWSGEARVGAKFLGRRVDLPAGPHALALASGKPLVTFFGWRRPGGSFELEILPPRWLTAASRADRRRVVAESVRLYARDLEERVRRHPEQWFTFEKFFQD